MAVFEAAEQCVTLEQKRLAGSWRILGCSLAVLGEEWFIAEDFEEGLSKSKIRRHGTKQIRNDGVTGA